MAKEKMTFKQQGHQSANDRIGRPKLIKHVNLRRVFDLIRDAGEVSRAQLSRATGSSMTTASKTVDRLTALGLIEQQGLESTDSRGRPSLIYTVARKNSQIIGISLEPHRCRLATAGLDGQFHPDRVIEFSTPDDYRRLTAQLCTQARKLMKDDCRTLFIGMCVPGAVDAHEQKVLISPNMHMLDGQRPGRDLEKSLGVETRLFHETIATCLAEQTYGHARNIRHFVLIGTYEGFGLSAIVNGELLIGAHGFAGELGHVIIDPDGLPCGCGQHGCLETVSTDPAFTRLVSTRIGTPLGMSEISRQVKRGLLDVTVELHQTLDHLATGAAAAINIFDPETLAVCSHMLDLSTDAFSYLVDRIEAKTLRPLADYCRIIRVDGDTLRGGVATAVHHIVESLGPRMNWIT